MLKGILYPRFEVRCVTVLAFLLIVQVGVGLGAIPAAHAANISIGQVRPLHNMSLCLDVPNPSGIWPSTSYPASGTGVSIYSCTGRPNQSWYVEELNHEMYRVRSNWSNQCLALASESAANNIQLVISTCGAPSSTFMRQTFAIVHRSPVGTGAPADVEFRPGVIYPSSGLSFCMEVPNSNGAGSPIGTWRCPDGGFLQSNQGWRIDSAPSAESNSAHDGEISAAVDTYPSQIGQLWNSNGARICSAASVVGNVTAAIVVTARHCVEDQSANLWFGAKYDVRRPDIVTGWFHIDAYFLVPIGTGSTYQDVAFLRPGGMYNPNWSWNGSTLNSAVGRFGIGFTPSANGDVLYSYGYPANVVDQRAPAACANSGSVLGNNFELDCQSTGGSSGSPWLQWQTTTVRAVTHAIYEFLAPAAPGGSIRVIRQTTPFFNSVATSVWGGV